MPYFISPLYMECLFYVWSIRRSINDRRIIKSMYNDNIKNATSKIRIVNVQDATTWNAREITYKETTWDYWLMILKANYECTRCYNIKCSVNYVHITCFFGLTNIFKFPILYWNKSYKQFLITHERKNGFNNTYWEKYNHRIQPDLLKIWCNC